LLLVLTEFPPSFGGMQTHAVYLCRHLVERGYPIEVVTYRSPAAGEVDAGFPFRVHRRLSRIGYWENVRILGELARRGRFELMYASTVFYGHAGEAAGVPMIARCAGNDVLRPWIAWPYRVMSGVAAAPWFEDPLYARFRRLDWPERWERILLERRWLEVRRAARKMTRVLANSEYTGGLLRELGLREEQVRVLAGGVDAERFYPRRPARRELRRELGLPAEGYVLMTACRLVPKKGLGLLLRALAALRRSMRDAHLVIVGEGRERHRCEELAMELGVGEAVTFPGGGAHGELHRYYWCADQFVLASREHVDPGTGLRDVETMGRVLCEANAAGVAVVAARSGGIPSVVSDGENGLLFAEDNEAELVARVERLRADAALAARLRENGLREAARRFDWSVICAAHEAEIGRALA
jgi:glycosyltransferase involved in cell wall biosynthesis